MDTTVLANEALATANKAAFDSEVARQTISDLAPVVRKNEATLGNHDARIKLLEEEGSGTSGAGTPGPPGPKGDKGDTGPAGPLVPHNDLAGRTDLDAHPMGSVTGLSSALAGKAASVHSHAIGDLPVPTAGGTASSTQVVRGDDPRLSNARTPTAHSHAVADVTGLQTALDGKAASSHAHTIANVTGLQSALDGKSDTSHNHDSAYLKLAGGTVTGPLTAGNRTFWSYETVVNVAAPLPLQVEGGLVPEPKNAYRIELFTTGTSSITSTVYLVWADAGNWLVKLVSMRGTGSSNIPRLQITSNVVEVVTSHISNYTIRVFGTTYLNRPTNVGNFSHEIFGIDAALTYANAKLGLGTEAPNSLFHIASASATDQLRLSDAADANRVTIGSGGNGYLTIKPTNTSWALIAQAAGSTDYIGLGMTGSFGGTGVLKTSTGKSLSLQNNAIFIDPTGNVGVGLTAPTTALDVTGTIKASVGMQVGANAVWHAGSLAFGTGNANMARGDHVHTIANVTSLQTALDGKAASSHTHAIADLPVAASGVLDATKLVRADDSRLSNARAPTAHSHAISDVTSLQTTLDGKAASSHSHTIANVTGLQGALDSKVNTSTTISGATFYPGMLFYGNLANGMFLNLDWANDGEAVEWRVPRANDSRLSDARTPKPHTHAVSEVSGAVPDTRTITAGTGLLGGGNLTANRTLAVNPSQIPHQALMGAGQRDHYEIDQHLRNNEKVDGKYWISMDWQHALLRASQVEAVRDDKKDGKEVVPSELSSLFERESLIYYKANKGFDIKDDLSREQATILAADPTDSPSSGVVHEIGFDGAEYGAIEYPPRLKYRSGFKSTDSWTTWSKIPIEGDYVTPGDYRLWDARNPLPHTHSTAESWFSSALSDYVPGVRTISPGTGLTGGGNLTANRTLSVNFGTTAGTVAQGNHTHTIANITGLQTAIDAKADLVHAHTGLNAPFTATPPAPTVTAVPYGTNRWDAASYSTLGGTPVLPGSAGNYFQVLTIGRPYTTTGERWRQLVFGNDGIYTRVSTSGADTTATWATTWTKLATMDDIPSVPTTSGFNYVPINRYSFTLSLSTSSTPIDETVTVADLSGATQARFSMSTSVSLASGQQMGFNMQYSTNSGSTWNPMSTPLTPYTTPSPMPGLIPHTSSWINLPAGMKADNVWIRVTVFRSAGTITSVNFNNLKVEFR